MLKNGKSLKQIKAGSVTVVVSIFDGLDFFAVP